MLLNYRQYITIAAGIVFQLFQRVGILDIQSKDIETFINIGLLLLIALFRVYRGRKLFSPKPTDGGTK